jgi:hypothetical protein
MGNARANEIIPLNMGAENMKKDIWLNTRSKWLENPN